MHGEVDRSDLGRREPTPEQRRAQHDEQRRAGEVQLVRHELTDDESLQLRSEALERLRSLYETLVADRHETIGRVPPDVDVVRRVTVWLASLPDVIQVADSPRVR